jgi:hypothetical protein
MHLKCTIANKKSREKIFELSLFLLARLQIVGPGNGNTGFLVM